MRPEIPAGTRVYPRKGGRKKFGVGRTTGTLTRCQLEGCRGWRVWVKWPDGHQTQPCSRGLRFNPCGSLTII